MSLMRLTAARMRADDIEPLRSAIRVERQVRHQDALTAGPRMTEASVAMPTPEERAGRYQRDHIDHPIHLNTWSHGYHVEREVPMTIIAMGCKEGVRRRSRSSARGNAVAQSATPRDVRSSLTD